MNPLFSHPVLLVMLAMAFASPAAPQSPPAAQPPQGKYQNFSVAVLLGTGTERRLADPKVLAAEWERISSQLKVDKVYIESEGDRVLTDEVLLERLKTFFAGHGVAVAGEMTTFANDTEVGSSLCYTDPADRAFLKRAAELAARHFDEILLNDYFFVSTKNDSDIAAKGGRSWTQFRLELMAGAGRQLLVGAAKAVNSRARVIIKYPNWYEHFHGLGFDLDEGPRIFDGIYTGTETRDPTAVGHQSLQQYESYEIVRYFENIAPGRNGGGWIDPDSMGYIDRYAEQLWDTMFAKAREMALCDWDAMLDPAVPGRRQAWETQATSFRYDEMLKYSPGGGAPAARGPATLARVAGYALEQADAVVGRLGTPIGIKSYRPAHGRGEDYLHNYIGMLGIPIDLYPAFPEDAPVVLLTEDAKADPQIVARIKKHLLAGKSVVATSGLISALRGRGLEDIVELELSGRRILADSYATGGDAVLADAADGAFPILFPQIGYFTNDAMRLVTAMADGVGYPLLLSDRYGNSGRFYVWTMPDTFHNLYRLPPAVITAVKDVLMKGFPVRIDGPSQVALFAYDNLTFIVESFLPQASQVSVRTLGPAARLRDLVSGETIAGQAPAAALLAGEEPRTSFAVSLPPHSFRAFAIEP